MLYTFEMAFASFCNSLKNPIYWIIVFIIWLQYKKIGKLEKNIIGRNNHSAFKRTFYATLTGIIGGIIGSVMVILFNISIYPNNFSYLLLLSLLLMTIHPRFICFSYSGGILSILSLIIGWPSIDIPSIMSVIAILHFVESILISIDGHKSRIPFLIEKNDKIVGCFNMFRFWPIPLSMIVNTGYYSTQFYLTSIVAMLGYGDISITKYPKEKSRETAKNLLIYSTILLILSIVSRKIVLFRFIAAVFSPVAHELVIQLGKRREEKGLPIFISPVDGIKILDVMSDGIADRMGLESGNTIITVNGTSVNKREDVQNILFYRPKHIWIDYYDNKGCIKTAEYKDDRKGITSLDMLVIPKQSSYSYSIEEKHGLLHKIFINLQEKVS